MSSTERTSKRHSDTEDHGEKTRRAKAMEARQAEGYTAKSKDKVRREHLAAVVEVPPWGHHNPSEIRRHDTKGHDRLFESRVQHDDADMESEKTRRARDDERHGHPMTPPRRD